MHFRFRGAWKITTQTKSNKLKNSTKQNARNKIWKIKISAIKLIETSLIDLCKWSGEEKSNIFYYRTNPANELY